MITWETKVNGIIISHVYAVRMPSEDIGEAFYKYEYYNVGQGEVISGHVRHKYDDGSYQLLKLILDSVKKHLKYIEKKENKCQQ